MRDSFFSNERVPTQAGTSDSSFLKAVRRGRWGQNRMQARQVRGIRMNSVMKAVGARMNC